MSNEPIFSILTGKNSSLGVNSVTIAGITESSLNGTYTRIGDQNNNNGCYGGPNAAYQKGSYYLTTDSGPNWVINSQADGYGTSYGSLAGITANNSPCGPTDNWTLNGVALVPAGTWNFINFSTWDENSVTVTTT